MVRKYVAKGFRALLFCRTIPVQSQFVTVLSVNVISMCGQCQWENLCQFQGEKIDGALGHENQGFRVLS